MVLFRRGSIRTIRVRAKNSIRIIPRPAVPQSRTLNFAESRHKKGVKQSVLSPPRVTVILLLQHTGTSVTIYGVRTSYVPRSGVMVPPALDKYLLHNLVHGDRCSFSSKITHGTPQRDPEIKQSSVPIAAPALLVLIFTITPNFPHHGKFGIRSRRCADVLKPQVLKRVDSVGATLLLLATLALTAGIEEAGCLFPWKSA